MKNIELYDIISLKNGKDYTVIRMIEENEKMYLLLAGVDENEEPDIHDIRIVEEITKNGKKMIKEIQDATLLENLKEQFSSALNADI